jgi:hypothetical protein
MKLNARLTDQSIHMTTAATVRDPFACEISPMSLEGSPLQPLERDIVRIGFGGAEGPDALQGRKIALS